LFSALKIINSIVKCRIKLTKGGCNRREASDMPDYLLEHFTTGRSVSVLLLFDRSLLGQHLSGVSLSIAKISEVAFRHWRAERYGLFVVTLIRSGIEIKSLTAE